ncbi:MAG: OpgC domain-containing protein, partial [Rhodocyclaceae bacterium]|nr:OpgC domain-containing protein [Rhodocyclaceae bacterium]
MPDRAALQSPARQRDGRIDVLRGLALVMIFINHVPGTVFEHLTNRNFG